MMSKFAADIEFSKLLAGRPDVDLVQLMLEFAADAYPDLDRLGCLLEIDRLGVACEDLACRSSGDGREQLEAVSRLLYEVEGFHGNRDAYYEPQNSYLNEVLARRRGIPISLGIVYMAVAARVGLRMFGVNTPAHFVVGCRTSEGVLFVDPFTGGEVLDREACKERIESLVGHKGVVMNEHFRPAGSLDIAARVLRNLKAAYAMQNSWAEIVSVQRRLAALLPECLEERRDLGLIYLRTGKPQQALSLLENYVAVCASDAPALATTLRTARKMCAELN